MKHLATLFLFAAALLLARAGRAQVGIGTATPSARAALEIQSPANNTGLLIPRLTAGQRTGIAAPPQGLMVYQTDGTAGGGPNTGFWYYTGTGGWLFLSPTGTGDNLGNHTATQNVQLGPNQLVGNGGTLGLSLTSTGDARLGKTTAWQSAADDRLLRFGDADYVTVGETDGDDLLRLRAKTFAFLPSAAGYAGSVGIGTAPTGTLDVTRGTAPDGAAVFRGTDRPSHFSYATAEDTYIRGGKASSNVLLNDNGGSVGVGTAAPFSLLANTAANVVGADGYGLGTKSLAWASNLAGYTGAFFNTNAGAGQNGLAVKVAGAAAATTALDVSQGPGAATAGASLLLVRGDGRVGVGTPGPNERLHVAAGNFRLGLNAWAAAADDRLAKFGDADYVTVGEAGGDDLMQLRAKYFSFLPSPVGDATYTGAVGIGSSAPAATLEVRRGTSIDGTAAFWGTARTSHFNYSTAEDTYIRGGKATSSVLLNDNGGNVGVGTVTPLSRLSITPLAVESKITLYDGGNAINHYGFGVSSGQLNYHVGSTGDTHVFYAGGKNGNGTELMRVQGNGTVGIGITNPFSTSRLHVASRDLYGGLFVTQPTTALAFTDALHAEVFTTQSILDAVAVFGQAVSGPNGEYGVGGQFRGNAGVEGFSTTDTGRGGYFEGPTGVLGNGIGGNPAFAAYGVRGQATGGGTGNRFAVYGRGGVLSSGLNYAGFFEGNVHVNGTLSKAGGTFRIDHPQDPENKYLVHSFVESPEMLNVYRGHVTTDAQGRATATLPAYFEAENAGFEYVLTPVGQFAQAMVAEEVRGNQFVIATDQPNVRVSWQVTGARRDRWALAHPINPEEPKKPAERGHYLLPELYGRPASEGIVPPPVDRPAAPARPRPLAAE